MDSIKPFIELVNSVANSNWNTMGKIIVLLITIIIFSTAVLGLWIIYQKHKRPSIPIDELERVKQIFQPIDKSKKTSKPKPKKKKPKRRR
jgi:hypothetical protein